MNCDSAHEILNSSRFQQYWNANNLIDNTISYTPNVGFVGSATISYRIKDTKEAIGEANVIVSVSERLNQAPIAQSDSAETTIGTPIIVDVIANDTDIDGDVLTVVSVSATQGEATIQNNKWLMNTPVRWW